MRFSAQDSAALSRRRARVLETAAAKLIPVVAVDVPSGVMGDTGESLGAVQAGSP